MNEQGELLFTIEEAHEIHKAAVKMLRNNPDVDVFTTMGYTGHNFTITILRSLQV